MYFYLTTIIIFLGFGLSYIKIRGVLNEYNAFVSSVNELDKKLEGMLKSKEDKETESKLKDNIDLMKANNNLRKKKQKKKKDQLADVGKTER
jgi:hypothetical protein